jgi:hypothetical protein
LDANRTIGQPNKLTLIFGRRGTHKGFLKQYVRDRFLLRTEPATNNIYTDYGIRKANQSSSIA